MNRVLKVDDLHVSFDTYAGEVKAVRGVTFDVMEGEVLAIVGESGCGKSVTAQTIMKLNPMPPARITKGEIILADKDIVKATEKEMMKIRGKDVSMIFQDPMTCLNPTMTVGKQLTEAIRHHQKLSKEEAHKESIRLLNLLRYECGAESEFSIRTSFPVVMRQRVMIAMALSCAPKLLIADEPTTALDVTIQAQIMDLLEKIRQKTNTAIILITHDLGSWQVWLTVVAVMYAGKIVEIGTAEDIFYRSSHPYTKALLKSLPTTEMDRSVKLVSIAGTPPDLLNPPVGCGFASRCKNCMKICQSQLPPQFEVGENHLSACWLHHEDCPGAQSGGEE
jgi:oligopeptide transport system ATP-binding protein